MVFRDRTIQNHLARQTATWKPWCVSVIYFDCMEKSTTVQS